MIKLLKIILLILLSTLLVQVSAAPNGNGYVCYASKIRAQIERYVEEQFSQMHREYQLEWISPISDVRLAKTPDRISVSHKGDRPLCGNRVLKVTFYRQATPLRSIYVSLKIHVFQAVWVTKFSLKKDEIITPVKLKLEQRDISVLRGTPLEKTPGDEELYATRRIAANRVLLKRAVRKGYLVHKGGLVDVEYRKGALRVKMQTRAMQNGGKDEFIWVKNPETRRRMRVKVVAPDLAVLP
ncbi:MAG TPA: flagellar basal body P-ring formation protein FlgA [Caldithrix sp.]|nr:flagellar basal body P-ring formation protein FlgA [Caldithrix sp.]